MAFFTKGQSLPFNGRFAKVDMHSQIRYVAQDSSMGRHLWATQLSPTGAAAADYAYGLLKHERLRLQPLILHNIGGCARRCPSSQVTDAVQPPMLCNIGGCTCGRQKDLLAAVLAAA